MFRPVLHYPFTIGPVALDVSGLDLHGTTRNVGFLAHGAQPGSGVLRFDLPSSRVSAPPAPAFEHLHALKVEATVRVQSLGARRNLVEGHRSFAFFIRPDGVLEGTAFGRDGPSAPLTWRGTDSDSDSPDGAKHTVPVGQWVRLTYLHDGFSSIRLFVDDTLVAVRDTRTSPVLPVGARGVHVGNWPDADAFAFHGEIDDLKIWRWDPDAAYHQFFCRPPRRCWRELFDALGDHFSEKLSAEQLRGLLICLARTQYGLVQAIRSRGEEAVRINSAFSRRYRELWCSGPLDGDGMRQLITSWFGWLEELLGEGIGTGLEQMQECFLANGLDPLTLAQIDWFVDDPEFAGYINILMDVLS